MINKMKLRRIILALCLLPATISLALADKGMWLLNELNKQNVERMRELGFTMPIDQLYSLDHPSLANAVVIFGGGCTGITVSNQGLIFTNHHCGYDAIQSQSSVAHDYLRDGFVSQSFNEELPIPGLKVRYLKNIVDVTARIEKAAASAKDEEERQNLIELESAAISHEFGNGDTLEADVVPFYAGNKYYVVVYNVFHDVRMVMAPPSSVGKFGGDTDNWMYPRHTGDFSVFRVYANQNNEPAHYSANNKPYKPVYYAKVSLNGYKPGDYAMTIGFPGSTQRYLTSWGVEDVVKNENEPRIEVRGIKQAIWKKAMAADQATRIKYASKYAQSSNYWKNAIGMNRGIKNLDVINRKKAEEKEFINWYTKNNLTAQYGNILPTLEKLYKEAAVYNREFTYFIESMWMGAEVVKLALNVDALDQAANQDPEHVKNILKEALDDLYKDYDPALDKQVVPAMLEVLRKHGGDQLLPEIYKTIDKKFNGSYQKYADYIFANSIVPYRAKVEAFAAKSDSERSKEIKNDPAIELGRKVMSALRNLQEKMMPTNLEIEKYKRLLFAAQQKMDPNRLMPSDANFTMRMSYGSVGGYEPADAVTYNYYTTEKGIFQKEDPNSSEFYVQPELLKLLKSKDFGRWGVNGHLQLCFLTNNDITGGNSGSPVFDKNGDLIGLAFDGNWEAMSGDIEFEPDLQRTICVDIRYVLFIIDKWAKCERIVNELTYVDKLPEAAGCCKAKAAGCCDKAKAACAKAGKACAKDGKACCKKAGKACSKAACEMAAKAGKKSCDAACKKACEKAGKACAKDAKACCKKDGKACDAACKKACEKAGKACAKDGKACCKKAA